MTASLSDWARRREQSLLPLATTQEPGPRELQRQPSARSSFRVTGRTGPSLISPLGTPTGTGLRNRDPCPMFLDSDPRDQPFIEQLPHERARPRGAGGSVQSAAYGTHVQSDPTRAMHDTTGTAMDVVVTGSHDISPTSHGEPWAGLTPVAALQALRLPGGLPLAPGRQAVLLSASGAGEPAGGAHIARQASQGSGLSPHASGRTNLTRHLSGSLGVAVGVYPVGQRPGSSFGGFPASPGVVASQWTRLPRELSGSGMLTPLLSPDVSPAPSSQMPLPLLHLVQSARTAVVDDLSFGSPPPHPRVAPVGLNSSPDAALAPALAQASPAPVAQNVGHSVSYCFVFLFCFLSFFLSQASPAPAPASPLRRKGLRSALLSLGALLRGRVPSDRADANPASGSLSLAEPKASPFVASTHLEGGDSSVHGLSGQGLLGAAPLSHLASGKFARFSAGLQRPPGEGSAHGDLSHTPSGVHEQEAGGAPALSPVAVVAAAARGMCSGPQVGFRAVGMEVCCSGIHIPWHQHELRSAWSALRQHNPCASR